MRNTAALLLRDLLSKLHPPSPATARDSARLLKVLDSSFRQRLDDAHPSPSARQIDGNQHLVAPEASRPSTTHLNALLHHPLLEGHTERHTSLPQARNAVEAFDTLVRTETVTLSKLRKLAGQHVQESKTTPTAVTPIGSLAHRIAAWLASESSSTKITLFSNQAILNDVLAAMYTDGAEDIVWSWLRSLYQREWVRDAQNLSYEDSIPFLNAEDNLVSGMIRRSIVHNDFADAANQYIAAANYRQSLGGLYSSHLLLGSYRRISSAILHHRLLHNIDAPTFSDLLKYSITFSQHKVIASPILQLYHPTTPSTSSLHTFLHDSISVFKWNTWHRKQPNLHKAILVSLLDAAQLSLSQQQSSHADFFLNFAETHFPERLQVASLPSHASPPSPTTLAARLANLKNQAFSPATFQNHHLAPT